MIAVADIAGSRAGFDLSSGFASALDTLVAAGNQFATNITKISLAYHFDGLLLECCCFDLTRMYFISD